MSRPIAFSFIVVLFATFFIARPATAGLAAVSVDKADGTATFTVDFDHAPQLTTLDSSGRPSDSFSIEIAGNPSKSDPLDYANLTSIVRGDEIHLGKELPIRDATPAVTAKSAGGWGAVRGAVPFTVSGDTLTFSAPLKTLGAPNGMFAYQVMTTHFGSQVAQSQGASVPLPGAVIPGLVMLSLGIMFSIYKAGSRVAR